MHDRFLAARRLAGLSQAELASRAGVSRSLVAAIEGGRNTPSVSAGGARVRALGVTAEELFETDAEAGGDGAITAGTSLREGDAVRLVRVGDLVVAAGCDPLADGSVADAVFAAGQVRRLPGAR